jgi:hypothetical protein
MDDVTASSGTDEPQQSGDQTPDDPDDPGDPDTPDTDASPKW